MNEREAFEKWRDEYGKHSWVFDPCAWPAWQLATQIERERCAKVCEYEQYKLDRYCSAMGFGYTDPVDGKMCAAAIRKGETQ